MGNQMASIDLHRLFADAVPFMPNDPTQEFINGVWLEARDGQILAVASDRFLLGVGRANYSGEDFAVLIVADAVKAFVRDTKAWCAAGDSVVLELTKGFDAEPSTLSVQFANGGSVPLEINAHSQFFPWRPLFANAIEAHTSPEVVEGTASVTLNFLGRLAKLPSAKKADLRFRVLSGHRVFARIGDDFQLLMMQKRSDFPLCSDWLWSTAIDEP